MFGLVGIGRIYLGYTGLGVAHSSSGWSPAASGAVVWASSTPF